MAARTKQDSATASRAKSGAVDHAFTIIAGAANTISPRGCVIVFGADRFLRRTVVTRLNDLWFGADAEMPLARFPGDVAWRDVHDQVATRSLFGPPIGAAVVDDADGFLKAYRNQVERFAGEPVANQVLVLDLASCAANTRLYRIVAEQGRLISCDLPRTGRGRQIDKMAFRAWVIHWAEQQHACRISPDGADLLMEMANFQCGRIDQELAKLAVSVESDDTITPEQVQQFVGGWRAETTWDMLDAACDGDAPAALRQLDRLLQSGEAPLAVLGSMAWSLRRFADATRQVESLEREGKRPRLRDVLLAAGFRQWPQGALERAEKQLRQIGRVRAARLHQRLLQTDLAMKGSHSDADRARLALEWLMLELARPAAVPVRRAEPA